MTGMAPHAGRRRCSINQYPQIQHKLQERYQPPAPVTEGERQGRSPIAQAQNVESNCLYQAIDNDWNWDALSDEFRPQYGIVFGDQDGTLKRIDDFVRAIGASDQDGFSVDKTQGRLSLRELPLACDYFHLLGSFVGAYSDKLAYSPHVELFFNAMKEVRLTRFEYCRNPALYYPEAKMYAAEIFNVIVSSIRKAYRSEVFERQLKSRVANAKRNFASNSKFALNLLKMHSKVLVLRIDLYYTKEYIQELTAERAAKDRQRLFNNMRHNKLFKHAIGAIWKLEYGERRGHHFHLMFFFNGQERRNGDWLADQIGLYWCEKIIPGKGAYHNCNRDKRQYWNCGIGMVLHNDAKMIRDLLKAIGYLTKKDQYLMAKRSPKCRTIGRSEITLISKKGGRPRRTEFDLSEL